MSWRFPGNRREPVPPPQPAYPEVPPHVLIAEGLEEVSRQLEALYQRVEELTTEVRSLGEDLVKGLRPQA